jgi:hypothetical protein
MSLMARMVLDTGDLMRLLRATVIRASVKKRRINRPDIFAQSDPAFQKAQKRSCMQGESIYIGVTHFFDLSKRLQNKQTNIM